MLGDPRRRKPKMQPFLPMASEGLKLARPVLLAYSLPLLILRGDDGWPVTAQVPVVMMAGHSCRPAYQMRPTPALAALH